MTIEYDQYISYNNNKVVQTESPETHNQDIFSTDIKLAIKCQQKGDLAGAELRYNSILAMAPRNPDAMHLLGVIHHQTGRAKSAIAFITQAIQQSNATKRL
ncbi:MAG: hypothetical protein HGJ94_04505 [Desulfosarcina sp.]|nr:hypothetical protein [Desulfosarcina sp.]